MATVTAIRHVAFEDLGVLEDIFAARGWTVTYIEAPVTDWKSFDALKPDLLVILGGPIGAYEDHLYPFLKDELAALTKRLAADKPTLGICLGAQLLGRQPAGTAHLGLAHTFTPSASSSPEGLRFFIDSEAIT